MSDPRTYWSFPPGGAVPDLAQVLDAQDLTALLQASASAQATALAGIRAERDSAVDDARAVAENLRSKGMDMDVDRMMRGSLLDRLSDALYGLLDRWRSRAEPDDARAPEDVIFAFTLVLAMTRPTGTIAAEYDAIDAEVERMVEGLGRQITVARGRGAMSVTVPETLLDELSSQDDFSREDDVLLTAQSVVAYWPPSGSPALALMVAQEYGGHAITVSLVAHGAPAHARFVRLLAEHVGTLS